MKPRVEETKKAYYAFVSKPEIKDCIECVRVDTI